MIHIPLDVAEDKRKVYETNFQKVTQESGRLMLFAGDQKVEHLNDDFFGEGITTEDNNPEHMFTIASKARIGAFATQLGLLAHYGSDFPKIPYIIKMNAKTNLVKTTQQDPLSTSWFTLEDIMRFKENSHLDVVGIGYTIYLGSEQENSMITEAAKLVREAHENGLLTVLWIYPRGKAVPNEKDPHIIAGAAGVAAALGTDFVKVNYPKADNQAQSLQEAVQAAGRTKLICAGGTKEDVEPFLQTLYDQIHISGASGNATGRNIHQRPLNEAIKFCNAIAAVTFDNKSVADALTIYNG